MAESDTGKNLDYAIARLKEIREEADLLQGMFTTIKKWSHITNSLKNKIDSTLHKLTGNDFYKPKEERKHP